MVLRKREAEGKWDLLRTSALEAKPGEIEKQLFSSFATVQKCTESVVKRYRKKEIIHRSYTHDD